MSFLRLLTADDVGLPWSYGVDTYGIGCVLAELYLAEPLVDPEVASDREHLATLDVLLGPFPHELARRVNRKLPGTFVFADGVPTVSFTCDDGPPIEAHYACAYRRLGCIRPVSVSTSIHLPCCRAHVDIGTHS